MNTTDKNFYDIIVIGGGPAGLTAAIYAARARYKVLVIEKSNFGGQITITHEVVNYPGVFKTSGAKLSETMRQQAEAFGSEFILANVEDVDFSDVMKKVKTDKGEYTSWGVVIATGASPRKIGFKGELDFQGRGVAYCATCDGEFFTGLDVFVIGAGFAAAEEAMFLTTYAKKVHIMVRKDKFSCADSVVENVLKHPKIEVHFNTEVEEVGGENVLTRAKFINNKTNETWEYRSEGNETFGVFVFAGYEPATTLFTNSKNSCVEIDERGYIPTDINKKTNIDGVYAAGDVCIKNLRQVVTAVSDGAIAATSLEKYVCECYEKYNIERQPFDNHTADSGRSVESHSSNNISSDSDSFFDDDIKEQLLGVFSKFESTISIKAHLNNEDVSNELRGFLGELKNITDKVAIEIIENSNDEFAPAMKLYNSNGDYSGVSFNCIPGGHEFNSFILALYNLAGPGQAIEDDIVARVGKIDKNVNMKVLISLSCTMCPDLVVASNRLAILNKNIEAQVFDIQHFPELKNKYNVMSVPCLILNDNSDSVSFGKKSIGDLLDYIESNA